ncbi:MAG: hypothetical protein ABGF52_13440, partial [Candidatus Asgardarchaeum sp.]
HLPNEFTVAGTEIKLTKIEFAIPKDKTVADTQLELQGSVKLPDDMGGFEGMLLNCSTRDKAIAMLNHNSRRIGGESSERAFNVYNKYKQIIDNHTFPDEVPQGTTI